VPRALEFEVGAQNSSSADGVEILRQVMRKLREFEVGAQNSSAANGIEMLGRVVQRVVTGVRERCPERSSSRSVLKTLRQRTELKCLGGWCREW
jgi:hypothetical protein